MLLKVNEEKRNHLWENNTSLTVTLSQSTKKKKQKVSSYVSLQIHIAESFSKIATKQCMRAERMGTIPCSMCPFNGTMGQV